MLTDPIFLHTACSTAAVPRRRQYLATRFARATATKHNDIGKALKHMWTTIDNLTEYLRAYSA